MPGVLGYRPQDPQLTGDEHFFRLLGLLLGEVKLLLAEPLDDPTRVPSYRGRLQRRPGAAWSGRRGRRAFSDYRNHALRNTFYSLLDEVLSPAEFSSREEIHETLVKVLARTLGSFSALYYLDRERRGDLSDRMRNLDRSWIEGGVERDACVGSPRFESPGPPREAGAAHSRIERLAERFGGDVEPPSTPFFFGETPGLGAASASRRRLPRVGDHLANAGLLSVRCWLRHPCSYRRHGGSAGLETAYPSGLGSAAI